MTTGHTVALGWLAPLRHTLAGLDEPDWTLLTRFEGDLQAVLAHIGPLRPDDPQPARSRRLLEIKRTLAARDYGGLDVPFELGGRGHSALLQLLVQFVCGYHDLDLRDAATIGHGRILARHGTPAQHDRWLGRVLAGELVGIAMTEPHGGTQLQAITTSVTPNPDGTLTVSGTKCFISRLTEAAVFIVLARHNERGITAVLVEATAPGVICQPARPSGLRGWSWGTLRLDNVQVTAASLLGPPGSGIELCHDHFAAYRPMVTATALGTAASVADEVATGLRQRLQAGWIHAPRDSALETIGRARVALLASLLTAALSSCLADHDPAAASLWGRLAKAHGVDAAHTAAAKLSLLAGARAFQADSHLNKALQDLRGLLYADGIHDALYRSAGRTILTTHPIKTGQTRPAEQTLP